jgi:hypothetical protein
MSVLTPKRLLFSVVAAALFATNSFGANPSPRVYPRMVFDQQAGEIILFGGNSPFDTGTQMPYDGNDTWAYTGTRWVQRFPAHSPSGRTAHMMAYDSTRGRIVLFGGRQGIGTTTGEARGLGDTWIYDNGDWSEIVPPQSAPARQLGAMAYDPLRDRVVLYGGMSINSDGLTVTQLFDTWEFDGTTWTKSGDAGVEPGKEAVQAGRPMLAYDKARNEMILVGVDTELKMHMYRRDTQANAWVEIKPEKMPDCLNDGAMVYQDHTASIIGIGGVCSLTDGFIDKTWEWNGTTWAEVKTNDVSRGTGHTLAYDSLRQYSLLFGGTDALSAKPRSTTLLYRNGNWRFAILYTRPAPRSLFALTGDPATKTTWLLGGLNEYSAGYEADFWGYRAGQWFVQVMKDPPPSCDAPLTAFDTDRNKLILVCWAAASTDVLVYEFTGTEGAFKKIDSTKSKPSARRQGALVYDQTLKKIVLFGGYDNANFKDDTWTWDGANWTEVKKNKPPNRSLHAMWYDPLAKKTIIYGGIGREDIDHRVERFKDMWSFNGTGWTKLNVTNTPGERLGPQYAVDPATGKLLLFGGLKSELTDPAKETSRRQFYDNETWEWNGTSSTWTKLAPATVPAARQNGRLTFDPSSNRLMLYGGYAGFFFTDVWHWTGSNWEVQPDTGSGRRRPSGPVPPQTPTDGD